MGITTIIVPEESNLADAQDKHCEQVIINMIMELKEDKDKCLNEDQKPQTLELNIRKILNRKIKLSKDF